VNGLCTGAGWREGGLALELRQDQEHTLHPLQPGEELAIKITGQRRCIGFRPPAGESLEPCPKEVVGISAAQCDECFANALILPCLRCDGERCRNPARRPVCVQPDNHAVYLASFGHGILKVGVARWERRNERVAEQGARAALIVARDDGQIVRRVEQMIRKTGIPDRIPAQAKLGALTQRGVRPELEAELLDALTGLRRRVRAKWLAEPEVVDLDTPQVLSHRPRLLSPAPGLAIRGTIRLVIGQSVIIDSDSGELVALEASSLDGYTIEGLDDSEHGSGQVALALAV
jgi:hypothetical protein